VSRSCSDVLGKAEGNSPPCCQKDILVLIS
jgi:hypothetical protein